MIAIIMAMEEEMTLLLEKFRLKEKQVIANKEFHIGELRGKEVVLAKAGIGKVNAAITATILLENFDIKEVMNIGLAGGLVPSKQMDLVFAANTCYHDVEIFDNPHGQMQDMPMLYNCSNTLVDEAVSLAKKQKISYSVGTIASGDQFITDSKALDQVRKNVPDIIAVDMEACAIAHTCFVYGVPFAVIRAISDVLDSNEQMKSYMEIKDEVANYCARFVLELL